MIKVFLQFPAGTRFLLFAFNNSSNLGFSKAIPLLRSVPYLKKGNKRSSTNESFESFA